MSDTPVPSKMYELRPLLETPNGSWIVRATSPKGDYDLMYRLIEAEDFTPGMAEKLVSVRGAHVASQVSEDIGRYRVVQRPFLPRLFTVGELIDETRRFGHDRLRAGTLVRSFLDQALAGLGTIHAAGVVHGDVRPEKFGFLPDGSLVLRDVGVRFDGEFKDLSFVAPELQDTERPNLTPSSDVYAFLQIARTLLQPFRGDVDSADLARLGARFRWLHDYFEPRTDRPSAIELREFLLEGDVRRPPGVLDEFFDAYNVASKRLMRSRVRQTSKLQGLGRYLAEYPETRFAIDGSPSGTRLAEWFAIASSKERRYSKRVSLPQEVAREFAELEFPGHQLEPEIDDLWLNSIHRMLFGIPMDSEHEDRMRRLPPSDNVKRELFQLAITGANEARRDLIQENVFLSTQEAIAELTATNASLQREEFMVLRRWGFVLAVPDHGRWLYPNFQFKGGVVSPHVLDIHERLKARLQGREPDPWIELTYWSVKRDALGGQSLKEVLWQERMRHDVLNVVENAVI